MNIIFNFLVGLGVSIWRVFFSLFNLIFGAMTLPFIGVYEIYKVGKKIRDDNKASPFYKKPKKE
ncbi:hypothetical protein [Xenorhabdus ishibashii]|uniref:Uncharacterized protein n=1 Tax=Xenorhabdus ishibashii TaxID=1034471 RepID=A0A2D0K7S4_9GAMM|nr:hypothetical protein [Xenorhabdus ishibashii]PHM59496.1 hypothetical protein Xish_03614 [Xenorhabdus ishibashii]